MSKFNGAQVRVELPPKDGNGFVGRDVICATGWLSVSQCLKLSEREFEIVQGIFDDQTESEIADSLGISQHTVHTHLERLYRKSRVSSRTQLIVRVFSAFHSLSVKTQCSTQHDKCPLSECN